MSKHITERQKTCCFSMPYMGKNFNKVYCKIKDGLKAQDLYVTSEECDTCESYKNRYMEFPLTIDDIELVPFKSLDTHHIGTPVRIKPCTKEETDKTYLGIYLGELPIQNLASYTEEDKKLRIQAMMNPAIYVFELKKIIYGCESYWSFIKDPHDFEEITPEMINGQWYIELLKSFLPT